MRRLLILLTFTLSLFAQAQPDSITQRIYLIGDAGDLSNGESHPVVDWLKKNVNWNDERNSAIYLGDNIYPLGLPMKGEAGYDYSKKIIDYQLSPFLNTKGKAYFVMGNHDWENGKLGGLQRVRNQVNYINGLGKANIKALPDIGGCPGPVFEELNNQVVVVFVDSQWFMYIHDKPGPGSSCNARTVEEFETELREIAESHKNQLMLIVTHHPMYSFGVHGGDYTWKEHLFPLTAISKNLWIPLPVLGSIYPVTRGVFGNLQDVKHPLYQTMVKAIRNATKNHPNVIAAAGHDHSLQLIRRDSNYYIVSGSGSSLSRVQENREGDLLFHDLTTGLAMLEVSKAGNVAVRYYNINSQNLQTPTFAKNLKPVYAIPTVVSKDTIPVFPDSVLIAANPKLKGNFLKKLFVGKNYREEWTTPVKVPVLNMANYTPEKQGGGKQTRSLRIEDKNGKEWSLRSVEKYPDAAIPPDLRQTFVKDLVADGISASYPYAGLSTEAMAKAAGVPYLKRKLVYIPDDPRLGRFRSNFKNTMAIMEERQPDTLRKTDNTDEVVLKMAKDNDDHVDQISVLKARLLDNFYMDLDRHEGQWEWSTRDTGKGKIYYPIPKDQDQAFFINQGIIPYFVRKPWMAPELQGFNSKADNIKTFNKPARNFDRFFLNELSRQTWSDYADSLLAKMTDGVIEEAMRQQPKEIRGFHSNEIVKKLKKRRESFKSQMLDYYEFLAKEVDVVGTNQRELFTIDKLPDNKLHLTVHKIDKNNAVSSKIYDRLFDKEETKELRLYGLEDRDSFVVKGGYSGIKIRVIGGPGDDAFVNESEGGKRVRVYDVNFEQNNFSGNVAGFINRTGPDPRLNEYNRLYYKYGFFHPSTQITYNVDDGLFLGVKGELISHGFRKEPYSTRHLLKAAHAVRTSSYFFGYEGDFIKAVGDKDLLLRGDLRAPVNVTNFFGIGNNTVFDKSKRGGDRYYRARYNTGNFSALLRRQLQSWMRVNYGLAFQYFDVSRAQNVNKFLGDNVHDGVDNNTLYHPKYFVGPQVLLDISSKNNVNLPTRGFVLDAGARSLFGLNEQSNRLSQLHWDMSVFISTNPNPIAVYGIRLGVGHNIGAYDIPQAQYLSGTENLRGFRRNRFAGRTMLFNNAEVRVRMAEFNTFLFPGSLGLLLFHDIGRVWADGETSTARWHNGYGGGLWVAPIRRWVVTASVAHSKEEKLLPYFSLGFRF